MRSVFLLACALALAGCVTIEQRMEADRQACLSYGFRDGSPQMAECRMTRDMERRRVLSQMQVYQPPPSITCTTIGNTTTCR